jgi:hypothetical protein
MGHAVERSSSGDLRIVPRRELHRGFRAGFRRGGEPSADLIHVSRAMPVSSYLRRSTSEPDPRNGLVAPDKHRLDFDQTIKQRRQSWLAMACDGLLYRNPSNGPLSLFTPFLRLSGRS